MNTVRHFTLSKSLNNKTSEFLRIIMNGTADIITNILENITEKVNGKNHQLLQQKSCSKKAENSTDLSY